MSDARTTTITDTDRVEWLLRYGSAIRADGVTIESREQVDEQIRKLRMRVRLVWEEAMRPGEAATGERLDGAHESASPQRSTLFARTAVLSAANRQLAVVIGDLRLRRCS